MTKRTFFIFVSLITGFLTACTPTNNVSGRYRSKFAIYGFFGTAITLNPDSTFGYRMSGDLVFDTSYGDYKLKNRYVMLYHKPVEPDTSDIFSTGNKHLISPAKYVPGHNKLFVCDSTGHVVKKQSGYSKRRQYIVFGKHYYKRRYYLKRVD